MSLPAIKYCPGTLAEGYETYSPLALKRLFNGKRVSHVLPFPSPKNNEQVQAEFIENRKRISISGVQEKLSLVLDKNGLRLTKPGESGAFILKPIPRDLLKVNQVPANEHLTMQIAQQIYGIETAENDLVFFADGEPAYLTRRFDVKDDGSKWGIEDFATLAGKTSENAGAHYKYQYSYEQAGQLIKQFVPAHRVEIEKYFTLVLFNFLFSNGDAHLKNFSLKQTTDGDYLLAPAYDLINTRIHVNDTDLALTQGLFSDDFISPGHKKSGHLVEANFREFGTRLEITDSRLEKLITPFKQKQEDVYRLIEQSYLDEPTKRAYRILYETKRNYLNK